MSSDRVINKVYYVYILQSQSTGRYYCGHSDDLERRISQHNDSEYRSNATTRRFMGPWILVWSECYDTRSLAMLKERHIKKRGIARFLKGIVKPAEVKNSLKIIQSVESRRRRD